MKAYIELFNVIIGAALCSVGFTSLAQTTQVQVGQHPRSFQKDIVKTVSADYLLYLPEKYGATQDAWPLILFLHGAGERGNDLSKVEMTDHPSSLQRNRKHFLSSLSPLSAQRIVGGQMRHSMRCWIALCQHTGLIRIGFM